jgi:uncharacterized protein YbaR (Trm112 family)
MNDVGPTSSGQLCEIFRCPVTGSKLTAEGDQLVTQDGRFRYPVRDGIPCFLSGQPIENHETRERLAELNRFAARYGWREALNRVYGAEADITRYVTAQSRADFLSLLELDETKTVLEIGPGLGQFSAIVAKRASHLFGLEVVEGQAHFAAARCKQEGVQNSTSYCSTWFSNGARHAMRKTRPKPVSDVS